MAATLTCLQRFGHEGVSVRRISAQAGVSMGLITHHFAGIEALVAAAYDALATTLLNAGRSRALAGDLEPVARLRAFFTASFAPPALDPSLFRTWLVFWSLAVHSPQVRAVHERTYEATLAALDLLLRRLARRPGVAAFRIRPAAIGLAALIDGLWVELSLNPASCSAHSAIALCDDWVHALAAGTLPSLRRGAPRRRRP